MTNLENFLAKAQRRKEIKLILTVAGFAPLRENKKQPPKND